MAIEYFFVSIFILVSFILAFLVFILSYALALQNYDSEKLSAYECGFQPFEDARDKFDVKFYLVAILFIIFDLEVVFLFPWTVSLKFLQHTESFIIMFFFLFILTVGFIYEWMKGALNWD